MEVIDPQGCDRRAAREAQAPTPPEAPRAVARAPRIAARTIPGSRPAVCAGRNPRARPTDRRPGRRHDQASRSAAPRGLQPEFAECADGVLVRAGSGLPATADGRPGGVAARPSSSARLPRCRDDSVRRSVTRTSWTSLPRAALSRTPAGRARASTQQLLPHRQSLSGGIKRRGSVLTQAGVMRTTVCMGSSRPLPRPASARRPRWDSGHLEQSFDVQGDQRLQPPDRCSAATACCGKSRKSGMQVLHRTWGSSLVDRVGQYSNFLDEVERLLRRSGGPKPNGRSASGSS